EGRVLDLAVDQGDLLHQRQAKPLRAAALDLAHHALRIERAADVLGHRELHHPDQAEVGIDLDHRTRGPEGKAHMRIALAIRVELSGRAVMEHARRLHRPAQFWHSTLRVDLGAYRLTGELDRTARHHRLP